MVTFAGIFNIATIFLMKRTYFLLNISLLISFLTFIGCNDDEDMEFLFLTSLKVGEVDISNNGENIPVLPTITAELSRELKASTVTDSTVVLRRQYDQIAIPLTLSTSGNTITITPKEELATGTKYELVFKRDITSTDNVLMSSARRTFSTEGSFLPESTLAYFSFEGNVVDNVGDYNPAPSDIQAINFVASFSDEAGLAAQFNGTTSIIEIPNGDEFLENDAFTIGFWIKADASQNGHFVLGLAGDLGFYFEIAEDWESVSMTTRYKLESGETIAVENIYTGTGELVDALGWTMNKNVTTAGGVGTAFFRDLWAHVVFSYNPNTRESSIYINGELVKQKDFDLYPDDAPEQMITGVTYAGRPAPENELALGFLQGRGSNAINEPWADFSDPENKQYKGLMDDLKVFSDALTPAQVRGLYNSEKPQ